MGHRFIIQKNESGRFYYVLVDPKGKELIKSKTYKSEAECRFDIHQIKEKMKSATVEVKSEKN